MEGDDGHAEKQTCRRDEESLKWLVLDWRNANMHDGMVIKDVNIYTMNFR